ncbi:MULTISPECIES: AMP-binding protein [Streptomyces]|uniref:Fatty acid--CoA ligase n=2 Tax=Streptomyces TaxID=1883 RepID=A0A2N8P8Z3_STRNR|nr:MULTISPECIES: AMP-binding protein [Streptomyces]PNE37480.1 fatty acid--CoA ligase [Streptomyces noursei]SHM18402.1 fatty-acyl-CoA synthase [Streptomyces yunnanensis]
MPISDQPFRTYVEENLDALNRDPGHEALVHQGRRVTAGEFRALVLRMARALRERGVQRGTTVTLLSGNLPETVAARYAANLVGARVNHLYNKLSTDSQAAIVRDVETRALIVDPRLAERAAELVELAPVPDVLVLGPAKLGTDLLELAAGHSDEPFATDARPDDICTIRHTGGTTGHPKGICTSFEQVRWFTGALPEFEDVVHRQLVCTTLAHAAGYMADGVLRSGGTVVLLDDFDAEEALATIERERITALFLLPPLLYQLMDHPDRPHTDTSSLRMVTYGGCQASPARLADAVRAFGPVLVQGYGQNEAGGISVLTQEDHDPERPDRLRSAGKVLPDVEVAVRDESGRDLPPGEHGEICVRSSMIMQGYWKQPELTAEVLRDGWLHTGDVGFVDEEGYLTIVDRLKDMIVVVGGHVYTTELEDLLNSHPQVLQSAVYGVRDADRMERVHATVVRTPGGDVDAEQLRAMVREVRGPMYEPARITFAEALPLTDAGKPDKKELRRHAEESGAAA